MGETKYGHLLGDDEESEADETEASERPARAQLQHQTVTVRWRDDPDIEYRAVITHGDHEWEPICTHVRRDHRIEGSNQFDPHGTIAWTDLPTVVQERVLDVVAGVERTSDLDPEHALGVTLNGDHDE